MAASKKRRVVNNNQDNGDSGSENNTDLSDGEVPNENILLDFEAYAPNPDDFHGIKQLLHQLFLKAHVNTSEMTDLIIEQDNVSSVLKNVDDSDETDDTEDDESYVFGVSSVINLALKKDKNCVKELKTYLLTKCSEARSQEDYLLFKSFMEDNENHLGYIVNERLINLPSQISVPIFTSLEADMKAADADNTVKKYNFKNYMIISKTYTDKSSAEASQVYFVNSEEEIIMEHASFKFEFSVSEEKDSGLSGEWSDEDMEYDPKRCVMIFAADKWNEIIDKLKLEFQEVS